MASHRQSQAPLEAILVLSSNTFNSKKRVDIGRSTFTYLLYYEERASAGARPSVRHGGPASRTATLDTL